MRARFFRFAVMLLLLAPACSKRSEAPAPSASQRPAGVAPPDGLVAELTVPDPRGFWTALRKLGGSRAEAAPSSFELALFSALDLPPRVAGYVRPDTPIVGVGLARPGRKPGLLLAVRMVRGAELVRELTSGSNAPLRAERDGSPVVVLTGPQPSPALGVADDWLLVADDAEALRKGGAYVARGLGPRRMPSAPFTLSVNRAGLTALSEGVQALWTELREKLGAEERDERLRLGRAPDFGDPAAVLGLGDGAVGALLELIGSTARLGFTVRPEGDHLELSLSAVPEAKGALARAVESLDVGSLEPLLELPQNVLLATLARSSEAERSAAAEKPADALRSVLGPRLAEKDAAPLAAALRSFHRGRGSVAVFGVLVDRSFFLRQEAREPKELERGLLGFLRLLKVPALAGPLLGEVRVRESETRIPNVPGPVHRVELKRWGRPEETAAEVLVHVADSRALSVGAVKARDGFVALSRTQVASLRSYPPLAKLARGAVPAALALYVDLGVMNPRGGPAPALAVLGRKGGDAELDVELSAKACAALLETLGSP